MDLKEQGESRFHTDQASRVRTWPRVAGDAMAGSGVRAEGLLVSPCHGPAVGLCFQNLLPGVEAGNDGTVGPGGVRTQTLPFSATQQEARLPYFHDSRRQVIQVPPLGRSAVQRTWSGRCRRCSSRSSGKGHCASVCTRSSPRTGLSWLPAKARLWEISRLRSTLARTSREMPLLVGSRFLTCGLLP